MSRQVYFGWSDRKAMEEDFSYGNYDHVSQSFKYDSPVPADAEILLASYGQGSYEGDALVIYRQNGELYEVHGDHCSCYGLEGQWAPEEATVESLKKTVPGHFAHSLHDKQALMAFGELIAELEGK